MKSLIGEQITLAKFTVIVEELLQDSDQIHFYQVRDPESKRYLLKVLSPTLSAEFESEVQGCKLVGLHGKLLFYYDSGSFPTYSAILFEFAGRLTLTSFLQTQSLNDSQIITICREILLTFHHIHSRKLVHRQLSTSSIFVTNDMRFKLSDFGGICHEYELKSIEHNIPQELRAPELINCDQDSVLTSAIDVWALGCLMHRLIYGQPAFGQEGLECQYRGKYQKSNVQVAEYWSLVLRRLLDPNPTTRASIPEIITLIHEPYMPRMISNESVDYLRPSSLFKKSSNSWVKEITIDNDSLPDQIYTSKLIGKAWNKPFKIPKFFEALMQRPFMKAAVALKCLIIVCRYVGLGPKCVFESGMGGLGFIEEMEKYWLYSSKTKKDKSNSEELIQVLRSGVATLKCKIRLHFSTKSSGDWSDLSSVDPDCVPQVFSYWENNLQATKAMLVNPEHLNSLKNLFAGLLIEEQQKVMMELALILEKNSVADFNEKFLESKTATISLIQRYKKCFPSSGLMKMYSVEPGLALTNSSIKSTSRSEVRSSVSSKSSTRSEERINNHSKRGSILMQDNTNWIINMSELELNQSIGIGSSCTVYKGTYRHTPVAAKILKNNTQSSMKEFEREVEAMIKLRHPNLVLFMGASIEKELCIVTEFCFGDTLFALLHEKTQVSLSFKQQLKMAKDTAQGMAFLHSSQVIHRDLKSLNLLLEEPVSSSNDRVHIKITDFGISRTVDDGIMTGQMGTCHWMAPEVLASESYGFAADVYSYGIVLWEIFARETPYRGINPAMIPYQVLHLGLRPDITKVQSEFIQSLIARCWDKDQEARPSFSEILEWLNSI